MTNGNVLGFLGAPDRQTCLRAISLALLKVRALDGMTRDKLGHALGCSEDTVDNAVNEKSLLSADSVFRLLYFFPDQCGPVREAFDHPIEPPTIGERLARVQRELDAIGRMAA